MENVNTSCPFSIVKRISKSFITIIKLIYVQNKVYDIKKLYLKVLFPVFFFKKNKIKNI